MVICEGSQKKHLHRLRLHGMETALHGMETTRTINDCHDDHDDDVNDNNDHDDHNVINRNAYPRLELPSSHSVLPAGLLAQAAEFHSQLEQNADRCIQEPQTGPGQPEAAWQLQCHSAASESGPGP